jgi:hypothetical protein
MNDHPVHACHCAHCLGPEPHPDKALHQQMNVLFSRLDEQQRRWYAAVESSRIGYGGDRLVSLITGLHGDTIRRGRQEMEGGLAGREPGRVRSPGAGRVPVGKKIPPSSRTSIGSSPPTPAAARRGAGRWSGAAWPRLAPACGGSATPLPPRPSRDCCGGWPTPRG